MLVKAQVSSPGEDLKLWYNQPASIWEEALPLGNGKTGAMVFGGVGTERLQLNDNTLWSGAPNPGNTPGGPAILAEVRRLIFAGLYDSATNVWKKCMDLIRPVIFLWLICG
ncbi:glycoside hydrolase family 95 protein [Niabella sp. W65]|nr:glycoside hydrolase family 95 protein [Niabella sp. W65]MCH7366252.1 glycoside hydrolase family 95 protein [Niabella sp. W65]